MSILLTYANGQQCRIVHIFKTFTSTTKFGPQNFSRTFYLCDFINQSVY